MCFCNNHTSLKKMIAYLFIFLFSFSLFSGETTKVPSIRLLLNDGKILTTEKIKVKENGDILFLHPETGKFMLLPQNLLLKMEYPKPGEIVKADSLFEQKKYTICAPLYRKYAEKFRNISPWENHCLFRAGKSFLLAGNKKEGRKALTFLQEKYEKGNASSELCEGILLLANSCCEDKDYEKAYPLFEKLILSNNSLFAAKALYAKGEALSAEKKWKQAFNAFYLHLILFPEYREKKILKEKCKMTLEKLNDPRSKKFL